VEYGGDGHLLGVVGFGAWTVGELCYISLGASRKDGVGSAFFAIIGIHLVGKAFAERMADVTWGSLLECESCFIAHTYGVRIGRERDRRLTLPCTCSLTLPELSTFDCLIAGAERRSVCFALGIGQSSI